MAKRGFTSDGNGGYIIQKGTFTMIMMLIALFTCISTAIAYTVTIKADLDHLKVEVGKANIKHPLRQAETEDRLDECEKFIATSEIVLNDMSADIDEMKADIKQLLYLYM